MGVFRFKQFEIDDTACAMKIGTDGVLVGAWARPAFDANVLDIGCGSGLISLMIAQRYQGAEVIGMEIDPAAVDCAKRNVEVSPWKHRMRIFLGDALKVSQDDRFLSDTHPLCIVSNPPFYTEALHSPDKARALARHGDGLNTESLIDIFASIESRREVSLPDSLTFIAPTSSIDDIRFSLSLHRLVATRLCFVKSTPRKPPSRVLIEAVLERNMSTVTEYSEICLRDADGSWSDAYKSLTSNFYLHF